MMISLVNLMIIVISTTTILLTLYFLYQCQKDEEERLKQIFIKEAFSKPYIKNFKETVESFEKAARAFSAFSNTELIKGFKK